MERSDRSHRLKQAYEAGWARLQHEQPGYVQSAADASFAADLISWLRFHEAMLIGEVIPLLYQYLRSNPAAPERSEFQHILVDEFQDLNKAEQGVIELLSQAAHVCIVGDDDQSIYSFKHAHPEGIREWIVANPTADDLHLSDCRRCPTTVVLMANSLIRHNQMRLVPRQLLPLAQNGPGDIQIIQYQSLGHEIIGVADLVRDIVDAGTPPGDILILAQRGVLGTPIYEALQGRNVPVRSYFSEAELNSMDAQRRFALLKLFVNREDRVALRWVVGLNGNNWNASRYRRLRVHCAATGLTPWHALEQISAGTLQIPYTANLIAEFDAVVVALNAMEALPDLIAVFDVCYRQDTLRSRLRDLASHPRQGGNRQEWLFQLMQAISQLEFRPKSMT